MQPPSTPPGKAKRVPFGEHDPKSITVSDLVHLASLPSPEPAIVNLCTAVTLGLGPEKNMGVVKLPDNSWGSTQRSLIRSSDLLGRLRFYDASCAPAWRNGIIAMGVSGNATEGAVRRAYEEMGGGNRSAAAAGVAKIYWWAFEVGKESAAASSPAAQSRPVSEVEEVEGSVDDIMEKVGMERVRNTGSPVPPLRLEEEAERAVNRRSPSHSSPSNSWGEQPRSDSPTGSLTSDSGESYDSSDGSDSAEPYEGGTIVLQDVDRLTISLSGLDRLLDRATPRDTPRESGDDWGDGYEDEDEVEQGGAPIVMLQKWMMPDVATTSPVRVRAGAKKEPGKMVPPASPPPKRAVAVAPRKPSSLLDAARGRIANPKTVHKGIKKNW